MDQGSPPQKMDVPLPAPILHRLPKTSQCWQTVTAGRVGIFSEVQRLPTSKSSQLDTSIPITWAPGGFPHRLRNSLVPLR